MFLYIILLFVCCFAVIISECVLTSGGSAFLALSFLICIIRNIICEATYIDKYRWLFSIVALVIGLVGCMALLYRIYIVVCDDASEMADIINHNDLN